MRFLWIKSTPNRKLMIDRINLWLANFFYYALILPTMTGLGWFIISGVSEGLQRKEYRPYDTFRAEDIFFLFVGLYILGCCILFIYWGLIKKLGITLSEFVRSFVLWLVAVLMVFIVIVMAASNIPVGHD